ncbi:tumor protein p63-regulated gene 1-like protein isoform X1 [Anthonomus grandis grandis]|uniref:tumor protein p63-regulated gene 1-like protein isoform X1 n=1 Tax=Anthonomus grandis grandis TaxID=2921223 RepID=UPI002166B2BB|nr:tumor protein p63-regulated gene 1-like protein isoform X1 [Anthonomus grandis grandis]
MSLEEDIHEEFRGGSLRFNKSGEQQPVPSSSGLRESYRENKGGISKTDSTASNSSCYWSGLPLPLSSLSTKITETLWSAKPKDPSPVLEKQAPIHHQPPTPPPRIPEQDANSFFTYRDGVAERAALECAAEFLDMEHEGPVIQYFLLTQINHWDTDKERLILLTPKILLVVKYDFIALKRLSYKKLPLEDIEAVIIGDLIYPNGSLIPKINGLADGISNMWENCFFKPSSSSDNQQSQSFSSPTRDRNMKGIRILFAKGKPIKFSSKWNPFTVDLPIWTFTYHPLYFHKDCSDENQRRIYDLDNFNDYFCKTIMELGKNYESRILHSNVLLENYVGFGAIIHNRNDLGFFKVRGKFSF